MKLSTSCTALLLIGVIFAEPGLATEFGCALDDPARALANDYNHRWSTAVGSRSASQVERLYADNAILMPPTDETIVGRAPIGTYLAATDTSKMDDYYVDIVACELSGDTLQFAGVWGGNQTDYRGRPISMTGNLLRVLDRQSDGSWALRYEIWN